MFKKKLLSITVQLASGSFEGGSNQLTMCGLRCQCDIRATSGVTSGDMSLKIFGIPLDRMNQMSVIGASYGQYYKNLISVYAGESSTYSSDVPGSATIDNPTLVFSGRIFTAMVNAESMPQVSFAITASPAGGDQAAAVASPTSLQGTQDVATILNGLASQMGLQFENNGVSVKVANPYYSGSPYQQAWQLAQHSNVTMVVDRGTMAIMPAGTARSGDTPLISPATGLVGYPAFNQNQLILKSYFNPDLKPQGKIQVQSDITPANGEWTVLTLNRQLDCLVPNGRWFDVLSCMTQTGQAPPA